MPTDFVLAHMWLNIAAANGHEDAGPGRNGLELLMSHADISRATELARACMASNYRDCPPRGLHRNQGWTAKHRPPSSDAHRPERRNIHEVDSEPAAAAPPEVASRRPARSSGPVPASSTPGCSARVRPQYTAEALRAKITGTVYLEMVVLPDGAVGDVRITESLDPDHGLDEEAVKAARQWLFEPGTRSGEPVAILVNLALDFNLPVVRQRHRSRVLEGQRVIPSGGWMALHVIRLGEAQRGTVVLGTIRYLPRVRREDWPFDAWLPELAPSAKLLQKFRTTAMTWTTFERRYRSEMKRPTPRHLIAMLVLLSHETDLAVGCFCEDEAECHRSVLHELLADAGAKMVSI